MAFEVRIARKQAGDRSGNVHELIADDESVRAEVWPQWGFNCLRWQIRRHDGHWADILYNASDWETNPVPTRSGHPILFPFPGRMRDGKFKHEGKEYQLPLNDSTKRHAIHGFTPRSPWRVIACQGDEDFAFVTGQFNLAKDLPTALAQWPADFNLTVTYRLFRDKLRVEVVVENLGSGSLPFGLGYHPYFRLPGVNDPDIGGHILQANVNEVWEADSDNLPTGVRKAVTGNLDYRQPKPIGTTELDNVFTNVKGKAHASGLVEVAALSHLSAMGRVRCLVDPAFRDLVLFIPQKRQAVAIEPYSCSADAANVADSGVDSGWRKLATGAKWEAAVEYRWEPAGV